MGSTNYIQPKPTITKLGNTQGMELAVLLYSTSCRLVVISSTNGAYCHTIRWPSLACQWDTLMTVTHIHISWNHSTAMEFICTFPTGSHQPMEFIHAHAHKHDDEIWTLVGESTRIKNPTTLDDWTSPTKASAYGCGWSQANSSKQKVKTLLPIRVTGPFKAGVNCRPSSSLKTS